MYDALLPINIVGIPRNMGTRLESKHIDYQFVRCLSILS